MTTAKLIMSLAVFLYILVIMHKILRKHREKQRKHAFIGTKLAQNGPIKKADDIYSISQFR